MQDAFKEVVSSCTPDLRYLEGCTLCFYYLKKIFKFFVLNDNLIIRRPNIKVSIPLFLNMTYLLVVILCCNFSIYSFKIGKNLNVK